MKPKVEMRIDNTVNVTMKCAKKLCARNDIRFPEAWEHSYENSSSEAVCFKWAATCGAKVIRFESEDKLLKLSFAFPTVEAAKDFCKDFEVNCY